MDGACSTEAKNAPTVRRKRVRSGESENEDSVDLPNLVPVTKKVSAPHLKHSLDRVALLDAGAQYGKVSLV
jgi:hypothetical protein